MEQQKLSIKDLKLANDGITSEVARQNKVSETLVKEFISFTGKYIADVIRTGAMESVMIPFFGKFRVKQKVLNYFQKRNMNRLNGKDMIYRAMKGKSIKDLIPKPDTDETV